MFCCSLSLHLTVIVGTGGGVFARARHLTILVCPGKGGMLVAEIDSHIITVLAATKGCLALCNNQLSTNNIVLLLIFIIITAFNTF